MLEYKQKRIVEDALNCCRNGKRRALLFQLSVLQSVRIKSYAEFPADPG